MKALVLAGGMGTRLRERVPSLPKSMAPVAGRPFLEYLLDRLLSGGVREIVLSVGFRAEAIQSHFGDHYGGASLRYALEDEPLGTGGAIAFALHQEPEAPVLVLNGDSLLAVDFHRLIDWYHGDPVPIAMVLRRVPDASRYGAATVEGDRMAALAARGSPGPGLINAGVYVLRPSTMAQFALPRRFSFEIDFLQQHCARLRPRAFLSDAYFIDIGVPEDYDRAQEELPRLSPAGRCKM